jgi:hypothetical protein
MIFTGPQGRMGIFLPITTRRRVLRCPNCHYLEGIIARYAANRWVNLAEQGWVNSGERCRLPLGWRRRLITGISRLGAATPFTTGYEELGRMLGAMMAKHQSSACGDRMMI